MPVINRHIWRYYQPILILNIVFSLAVGFLNGFEFLNLIVLIFASFGFLGALGFQSFFEKNTMYMFFNLGYSRRRLILSCFLLNLILSIFLLLILYYGIKR